MYAEFMGTAVMKRQVFWCPNADGSLSSCSELDVPFSLEDNSLKQTDSLNGR
jgi:hypothetical protein